MGLIAWWARAASVAPRLVNALAGSGLLHDPLMRAAGLTTERPVPRFATKTLVASSDGAPPDAT